MPNEPEDAAKPRPAGVPPPPSKEYIDQVSKDQALIADEWAPAPAPPGGGEPAA